MKNGIIILIFLMTLISSNGNTQQRGPGNPGGEPTGNDPPIGGGAPVGNGLVVLLSLGMAYLGRKVYVLKMEDDYEEHD